MLHTKKSDVTYSFFMFCNASNVFYALCPIYLWLPVRLMCEDVQTATPAIEKSEKERQMYKERERERVDLRVGGSPGRGYQAN